MGIGFPLLVFLVLAVIPERALPTTEMAQTGIAMPDTAIVNLFKRECASCHGEDGAGKTKAGRRAGVKDFTDAEYQATWTDEDAFKVVSTATKNGEPLRNKKPFAEKLTEEQIKLLIQHVRTFAAK